MHILFPALASLRGTGIEALLLTLVVQSREKNNLEAFHIMSLWILLQVTVAKNKCIMSHLVTTSVISRICKHIFRYGILPSFSAFYDDILFSFYGRGH